MQLDEIKKILKENKDFFKALEQYDKTMKLPFHKKRIDLSLTVETLRKLKKLRQETGKSISEIIEEKI